MTYVIKARSAEDAICEFRKDINSRINFLENRLKNTGNATEAGKLHYVLAELRQMKSMWDEMIVDRRP
jgi:hypothetical protein